MSDSLQDEIQDLLFRLEQAIKNKIENSMDVTDPRVATQSPRLYKFWCQLWFGHPYDKTGTCLRCGAKQVKK